MKKNNKKTLVFSGIILIIFMSLMIYSLKQDPNFNPSQLVGKEAPSFVAEDTNGRNINTKDIFLKDNWVVLNFWSSFCVVCRSEAPEIENFYKTVTLNSDNIKKPTFISINIQDDKKSILEWQQNYGQTFAVLQDTKGLISVRYGVTGTPETFFIDPNGIVRYRIAGQISKNLIFNFISWLEKNPSATQEEVTQALKTVRSNS
ncbi:TlpA family protein disulfide reductase [Fluviispira multicolorata]|uniref:Redoxin domain-containing protein n=1 Tax=Fluviispira multicolorata TaxID=2654512 RepID=A0A833JCA3_9BACT|nr:TlpA disulfide reductase family protein [Fluviispira multicolorata]KAB8030628.1 redoxin domain-containing protein [Fluviispira multicolorata]